MNNKEVAHLWANLSTANKKGSHFYFEGVRLYSYGAHFLLGKLFPSSDKGEIALINYRQYSATTAKHKSYALRALYSTEWQIIQVPRPEAESALDHAENLAYLAREYQKTVDAMPASRTRLGYLLDRESDLSGQYQAYITRFEVKDAPALVALSQLKRAEYSAKAERQREEAHAREVKRNDARALAEAVNLELWRKGENNQSFYNSDIALRLSKDGEYIETSRGARVERKDGIRLFNAYEQGQNIAGARVGDYTVKVASAQGVTIGCHYLKAEEIKVFFNNLLKV